MLKLIESLLTNETIQRYMILAIVAIAGYIWKKIYNENSRYSKALLFLQQGVQEAWESGVKAIKKSSADRKLTKEEALAALNTAKNSAINYAKKEGWDLLKVIAEDTIPVIIKNIVDSRKPGKNV